jgi:hypothetical protein
VKRDGDNPCRRTRFRCRGVLGRRAVHQQVYVIVISNSPWRDSSAGSKTRQREPAERLNSYRRTGHFSDQFASKPILTTPHYGALRRPRTGTYNPMLPSHSCTPTRSNLP